MLNPNADPTDRSRSRANSCCRPIRQAMLDAHGWRTYYYGNFAPEQTGVGARAPHRSGQPGDVWRTFDHRPRFGNNYVGLRNRIAILSEAYSYLDFKGRVAVTTAFVEECGESCANRRRRFCY